MEAKGIIFTALDTDHANIESWNRWYDLEHLPPNLALAEIAGGRRYVAPPELHEIRLPAEPHLGFDNGKGVNVTIYLTSVDPVEAIQAMTVYRDVLEAEGRMEGAGNRTVRTGDAMDLSWVLGDPVLRLDDRDVPHVGHSGIRVVLRRGGSAAAHGVAVTAVEVEGVHGVMSLASRFFEGLDADIYLLSGSTADTTLALREAAPYGDDTEVVLDAPFDAIAPLDYSFAERIRSSGLPATLDTDTVL